MFSNTTFENRVFMYLTVMTSSYASNVSQTATAVESQFKKDIKKGLLSGDVSLSNFRKDRAL